MNELGMPPIRPLPPKVRERALDTVLKSMDDAPPKWRWTPVVACAAAVVVVLTAGVAVALLATGPRGSSGLEQLGAGARASRSPTTQVVPGPTATALKGCIEEMVPGGTVVLRHEVQGVPVVWLAKGDSVIAFCAMGDRGPMAGSRQGPAAEGTEPSILVVFEPGDGVVAALVEVPRDITRVEIMTDPQPGVDGVGASCTLQDGLALCSLRSARVDSMINLDEVIDVVAFDAGGTGVKLPM